MERGRLLVDTSILIDHLRKSQKDRSLFYQLSLRFDYVISVVTESAIGSSRNNQEFTSALLANLTTIPFDSDCTQTAVQLYQQLRRTNQIIPLPDLFIAATAMTHDIPLLTLNRRHFSRINQLTLYQYEG